jgi:pimeloyl-ACP methyl ester carboxylesterase
MFCVLVSRARRYAISCTTPGRPIRRRRSSDVQAWSQRGAATGMINCYRSSVRQSQKEAVEALRPISAPTLVIWGERDRYLSPELAEPEHDDVPSLARVQRLADASHWVHHDAADRVNQLISEFYAPALAGTSREGGPRSKNCRA